MAKIKLTENEITSLIREAIENVKLQEKKPESIRVGLNEIRSIIKKAILEYRNTEQRYEVEADYAIDGRYDEQLDEIETINFSIKGIVDYVDDGIGSYEFQGTPGFQEDWDYKVRKYDLIEGTYDPRKKEEIKLWMSENYEQIESDLIRQAELKAD